MSEDLNSIHEIALAQGFDIEGLPLNFDGGKTKIRRVSKIDEATKLLITLDLILVTDIYQEIWEGRRVVKWNNGEYRVVSTDGMIRMKEIAGRPKDRIDLDFLRGENDGS